MEIIDAHLHLFQEESAEELAQAAGHHNSTAHLREAYKALHFVHGVVMGNRTLALSDHDYPPDLFHYCIGLDSHLPEFAAGGSAADIACRIEAHLRREACCGVKLYPGYNKISLSAPLYQPIYELAAHYHKPVAVHTGLTAFPQAHLKYCHPLALDEAAADHPGVRFVMCHFGNPFLESAAAVLVKNPNVSADLSGLLEDPVDLDAWFREQSGYAALLRTWLAAAGCWDRLLYGSDWPIAVPEKYVSFIRRLVPPEHWDEVFYQNAVRVYGLREPAARPPE